MKFTLTYLIIVTLLILSFNVFSQTDTIGVIIPCTDINIGCRKLEGNNKFIIRNYGEYQNLLDNGRSPNPDCEFYELPSVDFDKYTLIGCDVDCGGCSNPTYLHEIVKHGNNYIAKITIVQHGICTNLYQAHI